MIIIGKRVFFGRNLQQQKTFLSDIKSFWERINQYKNSKWIFKKDFFPLSLEGMKNNNYENSI